MTFKEAVAEFGISRNKLVAILKKEGAPQGNLIASRTTHNVWYPAAKLRAFIRKELKL